MNTNCTIDPVKYKSKLEAQYADLLEMLRLGGEIQGWWYDPMNLRLADKTFYRPDFMILENSGQIRFDETKGFWRDDARVKIKVAASQHPYFRFQAVTREKKQWQYERIKP